MLTRFFKAKIAFILACLMLSCAPVASYTTRPAVPEAPETNSAEAKYHYSLAVQFLLSSDKLTMIFLCRAHNQVLIL